MFEVLCQEKTGAIWRTISLMPRTIAGTMEVAERLKSMGKDSFLPLNGNPYAVLLDPINLFFRIDEVGLIAVMPFNPVSQHCHIAFWDRRLRGRERLCRNLAEFVVATTQKYLLTAIPVENRIVLAFARRSGFEIAQETNGIALLHFTNYRE